MEGHVRKLFRTQGSLVSKGLLFEAFALIVEDKGDKTIFRYAFLTSRFVDEDAQLPQKAP